MNVESNVLLEPMETLILDGVFDAHVNVLLVLGPNINALRAEKVLSLSGVNATLIKELCLKLS